VGSDRAETSEDLYALKFERMQAGTLYPLLSPEDRSFIGEAARRFRFTYQELRLLSEAARDLAMWREAGVAQLWRDAERCFEPLSGGRAAKKKIFAAFSARMDGLRREPKRYPQPPLPAPPRAPLVIEADGGPRNAVGPCPVCSDKTVCCGLTTIDAVANCAFACSYCTIQTFYEEGRGPQERRIVIDSQLGVKLRALHLDAARFYHFGTGQSSDSLVWGNRLGLLDDLCAFAAEHPNVLLELKTKSANIEYFKGRRIPPNVVCSWSLNTPTIIDNEEHFTAPLHERLRAARELADRGVAVAFHFHPMVYYAGWETEYAALGRELTQRFTAEEVLFVSLGTVTLIKPVIQEMRRRGLASKILQMDMVPDPHGKLTYGDEVKLRMFQVMYGALEEWHPCVYVYLCMERAEIWDKLWGRHYRNSTEFLEDFGRRTLARRLR